MKKLELQKCIVGSVYTNCYFLKNKENGELLIVDPGDAADTIERKVSEMQGKPVGILLTHGHFDHIGAVDDLRAYFKGVQCYAGEKEEEVLENGSYNLSASWAAALSIRADRLLRDKETLTVAGFKIKVIETPGHTKGCLLYTSPSPRDCS